MEGKGFRLYVCFPVIFAYSATIVFQKLALFSTPKEVTK